MVLNQVPRSQVSGSPEVLQEGHRATKKKGAALPGRYTSPQKKRRRLDLQFLDLDRITDTGSHVGTE
jgi:hypothetical protein